MKQAKRIVAATLVIVVLVVVSAFGQERSEPGPEVSAILLAQNLVKYGYQHNSPTALITAAKILLDTPTEEFKPAQEEWSAVPPPKTKEENLIVMDPAKLLQDAQAMAPENKAVVELASQVEALLKEKSKAMTVLVPEKRVRVTVLVLPAGSSYAFWETFEGGTLTQIAIVGEDEADLNLHVYDENDNLVASHTNPGSDFYVFWMPLQTQTFKVVVSNMGDTDSGFAMLVKP